MLRRSYNWGWSDGAIVLGKLPVPGRPFNMDYSGARSYSACVGGVVRTFFSPLSLLSSFSLSLWETVRYKLKYCVKGPLNPKQPTDQRPYHRNHFLDNEKSKMCRAHLDWATARKIVYGICKQQKCIYKFYTNAWT